MNTNGKEQTDDKRPPPKPRKLNRLWQAYIHWYHLMKMRGAVSTRIKAAERNKSELDATYERLFSETIGLDDSVEWARKEMMSFGEAEAGPIWDWLIAIKGIGPPLAAQLLAQIDDIGNSPTVASLWRFAGWAVIDGQAEKNKRGEQSHYNGQLKGVCWNIGEQFIRHQAPGYVDAYYAEKARLREMYPEKIEIDGKSRYTDLHIHRMACRKMIKQFLKDLWIQWRQSEGLSLTEAHPDDESMAVML